MINVYKTNDNMELMELELNENNLIPTETWIKIINPNSYEIDKISELTKFLPNVDDLPSSETYDLLLLGDVERSDILYIYYLILIIKTAGCTCP